MMPAADVQILASSPVRAGASDSVSTMSPSISSKSLAPLGTAFRAPEIVVLDSSDDSCTSDHLVQHEKKTPRDSFLSGFKTGYKSSNERLHQAAGSADSSNENCSRNRAGPFKVADAPLVNKDKQASKQEPGTFKSSINVLKQRTNYTLNDISDYELRNKVKRMLAVLPGQSLMSCRNALITHKGDIDDAMESLVIVQAADSTPVLQASGPPIATENTDSAYHKKPPNSVSKIVVPKIHEKYRALPKPSISVVAETQDQPGRQPKRRLVRGSVHAARNEARITGNAPIDNSANLIVSTDATEDVSTELQDFLTFFNSCSTNELHELGMDSDHISAILAEKPYKTFAAIREKAVSLDTGKRFELKVDRFLSKCRRLFEAYQGLDQLINRCQVLAKPIVAALESWGWDITRSIDKSGELEMTEIPAKSTLNSEAVVSSKCETQAQFTSRKQSLTPKSITYDILWPPRQPAIINNDFILKDYQLAGMAWLQLLYHTRMSCILADDMGLGKTCQVIAFLASLYESGIKGPHLIIVPGSTLENWLREFGKICPTVVAMPYYADQAARAIMRQTIMADGSVNVLITTYTVAKAKEDNKFLRRLKPVCCIYDEGHVLKNSHSAGYDAYMKIEAQFRLLLTGTPLQNNLFEMASLLGFILPSVFQEHREEIHEIFGYRATTDGNGDSQAALLSAPRIARARSILAPFLLRRKKEQVLKHLPSKTNRTELCAMTPRQKALYLSLSTDLRQEEKSTANMLMAHRKAAIHPLLFRKIYTDDILREIASAYVSLNEFKDHNFQYVLEDLSVMDDIELHSFCLKYSEMLDEFKLKRREWMDSGKMVALTRLLKCFVANGDKVLVFTQFTMVLDILGLALETMNLSFCRLDGSTAMEERQMLIDKFHSDQDTHVFILSTKAGGAGINLACANKVIIFDSSFNPQEDIQAENRAHRLGQLREVEIIRLVTEDSVEQKMQALGTTKLALGEQVTTLP